MSFTPRFWRGLRREILAWCRAARINTETYSQKLTKSHWDSLWDFGASFAGKYWPDVELLESIQRFTPKITQRFTPICSWFLLPNLDANFARISFIFTSQICSQHHIEIPSHKLARIQHRDSMLVWIRAQVYSQNHIEIYSHKLAQI